MQEAVNVVGRAKRLLNRLRRSSSQDRLLFVFTGGMGAWLGMGRGLYREAPAFRQAIDATGDVVEEVLDWSPLPFFLDEERVRSSPEIERRNEIIRMGMIQLAQVDLWRAEGVVPDGVLAISLGEMIAPYAAGALSRSDAARVLSVIAHAVSATRSPSTMFVLDADEAGGRFLCRSSPVPLDYLGMTMPRSAIVLARESDVTRARSFLKGELLREIPTEWNYHTPALDIDREWIRSELADIESLAPCCPIYSAAAGREVPPGSPYDADFFIWMVSHPFHFVEATSAALSTGYDIAVNVGVDAVTRGSMEEISLQAGYSIGFIDSMKPNEELESWARAKGKARSLKNRRIAAHVPPSDETLPPLRGRTSFETYEELRRRGAVHYLPEWGGWLVLDYEGVSQALARPDLFSSRVPVLEETDPVLLGSDPPEHRVARQLIGRQFSGEATTRRTALAAQFAESLLNPLIGRRELDVVSEFAIPLVLSISADLVGLDEEDAASLLEMARGELNSESGQLHVRVRRFFDLNARRTRLYRELLEYGDDPLEEAAISSLVRFLWVSSTTPRMSIPSAVLLLLQNGDVRAEVERDPALVPLFIDETLRLRPPAHQILRMTTEDVMLSDVTIPGGSVVQLSLAAANRDPRCFESPASVLLKGRSRPHLSFGGGVHRCVGATLAREQISVALSTLFRLAPHFREVQPIGTVRFGAREECLKELVIGI